VTAPAEPLGTLVVTGASRGIGAAVALLAGQHGYAVAVNYVSDSASARKVVAAIVAGGGQAAAIRADVAEEGDVFRLFSDAEAELGPLTALVNNAGITGGLARLDAVSAATLTRLWAVNLTGSLLCAREAVRRMSTRRGGSGGAIVNLSSLAARLGSPGEFIHYGASKGAIDTFTVGLAREVAAEGIRVNAVSPGLITTEIHAAAGDAGRVERLAGSVPMQRAGSAEEVAEAVLWLLSAAASYITGANLEVGGGR
jgi:NAD(P)-dependent dehydrogenase (short-subunit alcohol dehydrogenase family)